MAKSFYSDGLRFECQGSGKCCTSRGAFGFVYLTLADRKRMAKVLRLKAPEFRKKYLAKTDGYFHLKDPEKDCVFLEGKRCGVYEGRPAQCRTWPFWPENLGAREWKRDVVAFCPGVGKGKLYSKEEILELARQTAL